MTFPFGSFRATTDDGWTLAGDVRGPEAPAAVVIVLHAMMVNRKVMDRPSGEGLASALVSKGFAVVNADFRGHGESGPRISEGANPSYDDFVVHDVGAVLGATKKMFPGRPVFVVGHSLGGHASLIFSGLLPHRAPTGLVMLAANLWIPRLEVSALRRAEKWAIFAAWRLVTRAFGKFDAPRFRLGSEAASLALVEQFVAFYAEDRLRSRNFSIDYEAALRCAALPVLSVASDGDRLLAHPEAVRRFLELAPHIAVTHRLVRHGEFGRSAPDHMGVVTNPTCLPLWNEIGDWIGRVAAAHERTAAHPCADIETSNVARDAAVEAH